MGYRGILLLASLFAAPAAADTLPADVFKLVVDPSAPATLYATAGTSATDQGVYKSTDAGLSWTFVYPMADAPTDLEIDPLTPATLYVSDGPLNQAVAIYKSTDGGANWNAASSGIQPNPGLPGLQDKIDLMGVDPVDEGVLYAGADNTGTYKSTDGGQSWTRINQGLPTPIVSGSHTPTALIVDPVVPGTVYLSLFGPPTSEGLYQSTDSGASWTLIAFSGSVVGSLHMDPQDHTHLFACLGTQLESSRDGGFTWGTTGGKCGTTGGGQLAIDPWHSAHILFGSQQDKTIQSSSDGGASFGAASLSGQQVTGVVFDPEVPSNVYAKTKTAGLYISRDDGASWTPSASAAGRVALIHVPADKSTIQAGIDAAPDGDFVIVAPGTYTEQLDFDGKLIVVKSSGGAAVTILDGNDSGPIVKFHNGENSLAVLQGFTLTHALHASVAGSGAAVTMQSASPTIEDNVFTDNVDSNGSGSGSALFGNISSAVILRNRFTGNVGAGSDFGVDVTVGLYAGSPVVADNVFLDNSAVGLYDQIEPSGGAPQIYNNTILGNTYGLMFIVRSNQSSAFVSNNLIAFNQTGVSVGLDPGLTLPPFDNNLVYGDTTKDYDGITDQTFNNGNLSEDPMLADWQSGDVHPSFGSSAIDGGDPSVVQASTTDLYGQARVFDAYLTSEVPTVDIGAVEYHAPVISAVDGSLQVALDTPATGTLAASGTDPFGPNLFSLATLPAHGTVTLTDPTQTSGAYKYTPAAGYLGSDSFTFTVEDSAYGTVSAPASVSVTVSDTPASVHGSSVTTKAGSAVSGMLAAKPAYLGQTVSFVLAANPAHGAVSLDAGTGRFRYTPASGFAGSDSFSFKAKDQAGTLSSAATVDVTVSDVAPKALAGTLGVRSGKSASGQLKATAAYLGQVLTYSLVSSPARGTLTVDPVSGAYTYTAPSGRALGKESFSFKVTDQWGTTSNIAVVRVVVL